MLHGAEDRLSSEEYQALCRYLLETGELSMNELNGKIELLIQKRRIKEGLLTTAEQLIKKGFEEGEQIGVRKGIQQGEEIGIQKGEALGIQKGEEAGRREMAKAMINRGLTVAEVADFTGLAVEDIETLIADPK
ncbi:MAG: hypothetical protein WD492_03280 [Alkalispirochaeta sp.]